MNLHFATKPLMITLNLVIVTSSLHSFLFFNGKLISYYSYSDPLQQLHYMIHCIQLNILHNPTHPQFFFLSIKTNIKMKVWFYLQTSITSSLFSFNSIPVGKALLGHRYFILHSESIFGFSTHKTAEWILYVHHCNRWLYTKLEG